MSSHRSCSVDSFPKWSSVFQVLLVRLKFPETTRSFHWLAHPAFNRAVDEFLAREGAHISAYVDELNDRSPFRKSEQ